MEGILIFDDSTHSSSDAATDSLVRLIDNRSGVSNQGTNAKTNIPSEENIARDKQSDKTPANEIVYPDGALTHLKQKDGEYLKWLRKNFIEPLQKIQQAGIQNERASKAYRATVDGKANYFEDSKDDATTLASLEKVAEAFGGTATKNSQDNTRFNYFSGNEEVTLQAKSKLVRYFDNMPTKNPAQIFRGKKFRRRVKGFRGRTIQSF